MNQEQFEIGSMILYLCYVFLPALIGGIHLCFKRGLQKREKAKILLAYYTVISVGLQGLLTGIAQIFNSEAVVAYLNWPSSPFLFEVALANLAFGVLGIMSWWVKGTWRLASAIGYGLFLILAAFHHLYDAIFHGNLSMGNLGPPLWSDILVPIALASLITISLRNHSNKGQ